MAAVDPVLTFAEVLDRFRVSHMTLLHLIKRGDLKAYKVGRQYRFKESDVNAYLESTRVMPVLRHVRSSRTTRTSTRAAKSATPNRYM